LNPKLIIALGKRSGEILRLVGYSDPLVVVWNRAQAATPAVKLERSLAAKRIFEMLEIN
jgi:hypothetical protein